MKAGIICRLGFCFCIIYFTSSVLLEDQSFSSSPHSQSSDFWQRYYGNSYRSFPESLRLEYKRASKKMFEYGYDSYMRYAFPYDELNPMDCSGRGPDLLNP